MKRYIRVRAIPFPVKECEQLVDKLREVNL